MLLFIAHAQDQRTRKVADMFIQFKEPFFDVLINLAYLRELESLIGRETRDTEILTGDAKRNAVEGLMRPHVLTQL